MASSASASLVCAALSSSGASRAASGCAWPTIARAAATCSIGGGALAQPAASTAAAAATAITMAIFSALATIRGRSSIRMQVLHARIASGRPWSYQSKSRSRLGRKGCSGHAVAMMRLFVLVLLASSLGACDAPDKPQRTRYVVTLDDRSDADRSDTDRSDTDRSPARSEDHRSAAGG